MKRTLAAAACFLSLAACSKTRTAAAPETETKQEPGIVTLELAAQKRIGIQIYTVKSTQLAEFLQATGTVQPVNSRVSQVRSPARGRLEAMLARVGDRVAAGQELARFDNLEAAELTAQLATARAELQRLKVLVAAQSRQVERQRKLAEIGAAPRKDFEQSLAEQQALEESIRAQQGVVAGLSSRLQRFGFSGAGADPRVVTSITAPFAGIVTKVAAAPGEVIESGTELFTVADISRVWVLAEVYEKDLGRIRVGQSAVIHVDTYPDEPFAGKVTYIADALDPQTRTAKVRCEVANPGFRLKLDMFATIQLPTTFSRRAIAVPVGAIQQLDGKSVVFVQHTATRFEAREIQPGRTLDAQVEILSGLKDGEKIVDAGAFHLKSILAGKDLGEE
jgi:cobalt-zinc-cadmium efflux system membrane fusion protein